MKKIEKSIDDLNKLNSDNEKIYFNSAFIHENLHRGLRPKDITLIIGERGSGKSTLARTMILEKASAGHKVGVWLSEEEVNQYVGQMTAILKRAGADYESVTSKMSFFSFIETKFIPKTPQELFNRLESDIVTNGLKMLFFDNITTSPLYGYGNNFSKQNEFIDVIKDASAKFNIPIIVLAHAEAHTDTSKTLINGENVRGSKHLTNMAGYIYCHHAIRSNIHNDNLLFIDKSRYHQDAQKKWFRLTYNVNYKIFTSSKETTHEDAYGVLNSLASKLRQAKASLDSDRRLQK